MQPSVAQAPAYLYVPNALGAPITTVIDQRTRKMVRVLQTGTLSQHVTPSYDMSTLYVEASSSNQIVQLDPMTGRVVRPIPVDRPYNLYFTPDGKRAIVMDEEHQKIIFADPHTFAVRGRRRPVLRRPEPRGLLGQRPLFLVVSCEFCDVPAEGVDAPATACSVGSCTWPPNSKPQDVRLAPDGRSFYVADMDTSSSLRIGWRPLR